MFDPEKLSVSLRSSLSEIYDQETVQKIISGKLTVLGEKEARLEQQLHFTVLNRYDDSQKNRKKHMVELFRALPLLEFVKLNKEKKILETTHISKTYFRIFFDIEGDFDQSLFEELIVDFKKFVSEEYHMKCEESWTKNNMSVHGKSSFHLFFNIYTRLNFMPFVINCFDLKTNYKYHKIIDRCVYRYGRLFRCPFSLRPQQKCLIPGDGRDVLNEQDFHVPQKGELSDCLIGNIIGCHKILPEYISCIGSFRNDTNISDPAEKKNEKKNENEKQTKTEKTEDEKNLQDTLKELNDIKTELNKLSKLFK